MRFSEAFSVNRSDEDDWFDPVLSVDTPLFVDPFLIYDSEENEFEGSHSEIIQFFNEAFRLVAQAGGNPLLLSYKKALSLLLFPEVQELCLGYTSVGTKGLGSGSSFARIMVEALWEGIRAGSEEITHFEEVGILREGIGADRISDITACLLRRRLAEYTNHVCLRHGIPMQPVSYTRGFFDANSLRWRSISLPLPTNPFTNKPVLLIPQRYIRELPTINADEFWNYCADNNNDIIRNEFNFDISRNVSKSDIVKLARRHPELRKDYLATIEQKPGRPYNTKQDRKGYVQWYPAAQEFCSKHPLAFGLATPNDFISAVDEIVGEYKHFIEQNGGWQLLWNDDGTSKGERAAQLLFLGLVMHYCRANDMDVSPEPNVGRGPVDFKVSHGYKHRALLEVKLARNTKFWNGLQRQLPTYLNAERETNGYFIVIVFSKADAERVKIIAEVTDRINSSVGCSITPIIVDAMPNKLSASKL